MWTHLTGAHTASAITTSDNVVETITAEGEVKDSHSVVWEALSRDAVTPLHPGTRSFPALTLSPHGKHAQPGDEISAVLPIRLTSWG